MSTSPASDAHAVYLRYITAIVLHGNASAAALGLGGTDLYALGALSAAGPMTSGELATATGLTTGATTRLIDRLEQAGHVRRVSDPADRRKVRVEPTGRPTALDDTVDPARRLVGEIISGYPEEQRAVLFDYFARAAQAYEEATATIRSTAASPATGGR